MKILFVIDTYHRGRHVLIELPFSGSGGLKKHTEGSIASTCNFSE
jgi:hypothetical protein